MNDNLIVFIVIMASGAMVMYTGPAAGGALIQVVGMFYAFLFIGDC